MKELQNLSKKFASKCLSQMKQKMFNGNCLQKCVEGMANKGRKLQQIGRSHT